MAISKLDFARGHVVNPLDSIGDDLLKFGSSLHQQEKDRLAAERQNELLAMQKQEHQMKVDAVAQAAKEKQAANTYADVLGAATSGNVVGLADQKLLGDKVGALGNQAAAAYAGGDKVLGDKLVAEQESYVTSVLPKMTKAYEASPEAQLQVLRGTNPLGGTADLAPQTRLALLKEAEAPIEKMQATNAAYAAKLEEAKIRAAERAHDKSLAAQQAMILAKFNADHQMEIAKFNADHQMEIAKMRQEGKATTNDAKTVLATVDGEEILMSPNQVEKTRNSGAKITAMRVIGTDPDGESGGGNGGGGGAGGKGKSADGTKIGNVVLPSMDANLLGWKFLGSGDLQDAANTVKGLKGLGYSDKDIQSGIDLQDATNADSYFSEKNVDDYVLPMQIGKSGVTVAPSVALQLQQMLGKELVTDTKGNISFSEATKDITEKDLLKLGFVKDANNVMRKVGAKELKAGVVGSVPAVQSSGVLPKPVQSSIYGQGPELAAIIRANQDNLVKSYDPALPNKQWLANTKAEIYRLRQSLGGDEFERRYPGVAANLKLY